MKKDNAPKIEPWGTPAIILAQEEACPFNNTLCYRLSKIPSKISHRLPDTLFCSNLNMTPPCQTLSKSFQISRKTLT